MAMKGVLHIPLISKAGVSPSDGLMSYQYTHWEGGGSYPSTETQSVYSTASADWAAIDGRRIVGLIMQNVNSLIPALNLGSWVPFLKCYMLHYDLR